MTITSTNSPDGVLPGHDIPLTCIVSPKPSEGVIYLWRSSVQGHTQLSSLGLDDEEMKQINFRIFEEYPPLVRVFCHALNARDKSYLGVGHIDIQIQGCYEYSSIIILCSLACQPLISYLNQPTNLLHFLFLSLIFSERAWKHTHTYTIAHKIYMNL